MSYVLSNSQQTVWGMDYCSQPVCTLPYTTGLELIVTPSITAIGILAYLTFVEL